MRARKVTAPAIVTALVLAGVAASGAEILSSARGGDVITGPYASLLAASTNLGPSRAENAQLTVKLSAAARPAGLIGWAEDRGLAVRWRPATDWAIVSGPAEAVSRAFDVPIDDFKGRRGQNYYASPMQPRLPAELNGEATAVGRILSYLPHRNAQPPLPRDVPEFGLTPQHLLTAYNATPLVDAGYHGQGQTVVIFGFDGFEQSDLDMFADTSGLPRFTPEIVGGPLGPARAETVMDLEVVHAIAPQAKLVVVNALPTVEDGGGFEKIAEMFNDAAERYPNSVWSLSIGWGCEAMVTAADIAPVRAALTNAHRRGVTVFVASGDTAGLECKGGKDWSSPPGPADIGVDTVASLPEVTSVGGTTLSTDRQGRWLEERAWIDAPLSQGSSGGISQLSERPAYQRDLKVGKETPNRVVPDVSAVADPFTGVRIIVKQNPVLGGGTSQAAPIWAGMTALMNQYIIDNDGIALGDINPLLYQVAQGSKLPGFRDITAGSNAVDTPVKGYDLVTGLGTPNVDNLARNLLEAQERQLQARDYLPDGG